MKTRTKRQPDRALALMLGQTLVLAVTVVLVLGSCALAQLGWG